MESINLGSLLTPAITGPLGAQLLRDILGTKPGNEVASAVLGTPANAPALSPEQAGELAIKTVFNAVFQFEPHLINTVNAEIDKSPGDDTVHHFEHVAIDGVIDKGLHAAEAAAEAKIGG